MKCRFGCYDYGKTCTCPPNVPDIEECKKFFDEYTSAALLHFHGSVEKPEDRHAWTKKINLKLFDLERAVFLEGYQKSFVLYIDPCNLCKDCSQEREECKIPLKARPSPEAFGVDVFTTARKCGFEIEVLKEYSQNMNRFGILLVK